MDFLELKTKLLSYKSKQVGKGVDKEKIKQAEKSLGVLFPKSYVSFLTEFGWGGIEHIEVYGLGDEIPEYLDVVKMTLSEREEMEPSLQHHLIPLMNDGAGNHYCLDTSKMSGEECPVVFWDHEEGKNQIPEIVSSEFVTWFMDMIDEI